MTMKTMKTGGYTVKFHSYCGLTLTLGEGLEREEAAAIIRARLKRAKRQGLPVSKVGKGEWEIETPDDAGSIGDGEGILTLRATRKRYRRVFGRRVIIG